MPSKWFPVDLYTHATAQIQPVGSRFLVYLALSRGHGIRGPYALRGPKRLRLIAACGHLTDARPRSLGP